MGWLKYMASKSGVKSLAKLAERLVDVDGWPLALEARALGTRLAALDRDADLGWWTRSEDRMKAARLIARALGLAEEEVVDHIVSGAKKRPEDQSLWPLPIDAAGGIDLTVEGPFPGVPRLVQAPREWKRVWWHAPQGAGRSLVAAWLRQQGLVLDVERYATWDDFRAALDERKTDTPLYAEVDAPGGMDFEGLAIPDGHRVCVAAPFEAPEPPPMAYRTARRARRDGDTAAARLLEKWTFVATAAPSEWFDDLMQWLLARVGENAGVDIEAITNMFVAHPFIVQWVRTPGAVLDLVGIVEAVGLPVVQRAMETDDFAFWIDKQVALLAERKLARDAPARRILLEQGARLLVAGFRGCALEGLGTADHHPTAKWAAWVGTVAPPADPGAAIELLETARRSPKTSTIDAVLQHLRPTPAAIIDGLVQSQVLRGTEADGYRLEPSWLRTLVDMSVLAGAVTEGPALVGALLVAGMNREDLVEEVYERSRLGDWSFVDASVAAWGQGHDIKAAICIDVAFRVAGLAVLAGVAPPATLRELWTAAHSMSIADPRTEYPRPIFDGGNYNEPFDHHSLWEIACLTLSERLGEQAHGAHPAVAPWRRAPSERSNAVATVLSLAEQGLPGISFGMRPDTGRADVEDWAPLRLAAFRMAGRLLDDVGYVPRPGRGEPATLMAPAVVVAAFAKGEAVPALAVEQVLHLRDAVPALRAEAEHRGVAWDDLLRWLWGYWATEGGQQVLPLRWLNNTHPGSADVWGAMPPAVATVQAFADAIGRQGAWRFIGSEDVWDAFLGHDSVKQGMVDAEVFERAPEAVLMKHLRLGHFGGGGQDGLQAVLWRRFPDALIDFARDATAEDAAFVPVVYYVPPEHAPVLVEIARAAVESGAPMAAAWRSWLRSRIARRHAGWPAAFEIVMSTLPAVTSPPLPETKRGRKATKGGAT